MNEEEETLLDRAFLITTGHWESHGGQVGCEVCDFNHALLERRKRPAKAMPETCEWYPQNDQDIRLL